MINNPWPKNRYVGFMPPDDWTGKKIAIRVALADVESNTSCNGSYKRLAEFALSVQCDVVSIMYNSYVGI